MGLITNADTKLTPAQRAAQEKDERNDARIQNAVDAASETNPAPKLLTPDQKLVTTFDRLSEREAYASGDRPSIIPLSVRVGDCYEGGFRYILSDADMRAVEAGAYCEKCLVRQPSAWTPDCHVCGHERRFGV